MDIRTVSYKDILDAPNAKGLFRDYSNECSIPELGEINPQAQLYEAMERSGGMHTFGVYDGDLLAGFAVVLIYPLPHYGMKIATTESLYLAVSYRRDGLGERMLRHIEEFAKLRGCRAVLYTAPTGSRFSRLLSFSHEYKLTNQVYMRPL